MVEHLLQKKTKKDIEHKKKNKKKGRRKKKTKISFEGKDN